MDVQLRKINFVREFLQLNNEQAITNLESLLRKEKHRIYSESPQPLTEYEFNTMIDKAEEDAEAGRLMDSRDLKKDIQSWD